MQRPHNPVTEESKQKEPKSKFVRYCINTVLCVLICCIGFVFLVFRTNSIYAIEEVINKPITVSKDITVKQVISAVGEDGDNSANTPGVFPESGDWYSDFPADMRTKGSVVKTLPVTYGDDIPLYNNIPWDYEDGCYVYNINTACDDLIKLLDANADQPTGLQLETVWSRESPNPDSFHGLNPRWYPANATTCINIQGVNALATALPPCAVTREYNDGFKNEPSQWYKTAEVNGLISDMLFWQAQPLRLCIIVEEKDTGNQYFIPACLGDMKGHTWPGGVTQTEARLRSGQSPDGPFIIDIGDSYQNKGYALNTQYTIREMANNLDTIPPEINGGSTLVWRYYIKCCIEVCIGPDDTLNQLRQFDVKAIMAWPQ